MTEPVVYVDDDELSLQQHKEKYNIDTVIHERYKYVRHVSRGASGIVDLVEDIKTNNHKALKRVTCANAEEMNEAMHEVFAMRSIKHPNLLDIESVFVVSDS